MGEQLFFDSWKKKNTINYDRKGKLNTKNYKEFKDICRLTQRQVKKFVIEVLKLYYKEVIEGDGFVYAQGTNCNVLLTAHMDTVHKSQCTDIYEYVTKAKQTILSSPQGIGGDDRCGVYAILEVLKRSDIRPSILFCEDEEDGGIGSEKFCNTNYLDDICSLNYMIEIDRANANDCVFYEDTNEDFIKYIESVSKTKEAYGSFSDICNLSSSSGVSSFNISCGYYNAHTTSEYVVMEELEDCIAKVIGLLKTNQTDDMKFDWTPARCYGYGYSYGYGYNNYSSSKTNLMQEGCEFYYYDENKDYVWEFVEGYTLEECVGIFMMSHPDFKWNDIVDYETY